MKKKTRRNESKVQHKKFLFAYKLLMSSGWFGKRSTLESGTPFSSVN